MKHLEVETINCKGILKNGKPYTLCLGAGICFGIMPDWKGLTFEILKDTIDPHITVDQFDNITQSLGWSLDSILQATLNFVVENGGNVNAFNELIQNKLYSKIVANAGRFGLASKLQKFISDPFNRNSADVIDLYNFFEGEYSGSSLFQIAKFLIEAKQSHRPPSSIMTFNADVLLHALLTLLQLKESFDKTGLANSADFYYKAVHRVIESDGHKIPIYHIHGSIVPFVGKRDARQNLVFQETSYHQVSGSTHSWQQNIFQHLAFRDRIVFIGLSMSDPNIRRWLAHTSSVLHDDVFNITGRPENIYPHIWLTPRASSDTERTLKKLGLSHLGVKVGELDNWGRLYSGLKNLVC